MTLLAHALQAARAGHYVFPVEPFEKTPGRLYPNRTKEEAPWTVKWSEVATVSYPVIVQWWNEAPWRNVGIACAPSQLLVVDCDIKPDGDGLEQFTDMTIRYGKDDAWEAFDTYTVRTGSGGTHFYYRWPAGVQASQSGISSHVDIRSNGGQKGGYVLGAGSITGKGPYRVEEEFEIRPAPAWLVELCRDRPRPKPVRSAIEQPAALSFSGLVTSVATAPEGNRNAALHWAARSMCSDGADESEAIRLLVQPATDNGLTDREATDTIRSGYRLQRQKDGR